jgi:signal transduction histidine kinase
MNQFYKIFTGYLMLSFFSLHLSAQTVNVDSLKAIVNSQQPDTTRIKATERLVNFYRNSNVDSAIIFAKEMLYLSRKNNLRKKEAYALNKLGGAYEKYKGIESDTILAIFQQALDIAEELEDIKLKTHLLNNMGVINMNKGAYDKTIELCFEALEIAKEIELNVSIIQSLNLISAVFFYQKDYEKALSYARQGLAYAKKTNNLQYIANFTNNIASFHSELGQEDSTLVYYEESLEITKKNNMGVFSTLTLIDMGVIYKNKGRLSLAQKYVAEAYEIAKKSNYTHGIAHSLVGLSEISFAKKEYKEAIRYLKESFDYTTKIKLKLNYYKLLKEYNNKMGDYKSALEAMENYSILRDSIFNIDNSKQIEELTTKYEVTQKETENQLLKEKSKSTEKIIRNQMFAAIGLILALLFAISWGIVIYRANQQKKRLNQILEDKVNLRTRELQTSNKNLEQANTELRTFNYIASHDIKEPIRVIGSYVGLIKRKLPADLKESLSDYFELIKSSTTQLYTLIEDFANYTTMSKKEMIKTQDVDLNLLTSNIVNNLDETIEKYQGKVEISNLPTIKSSNSLLFTTLKNLIENGLKYNKSEKPTVSVNYNKTETHHEIIISDNGIGIDKLYHEKIFEMFKRLHNRAEYDGSGIGLAIVKLSVDKLGGTVELESEEGKGSRFVIQLPI